DEKEDETRRRTHPQPGRGSDKHDNCETQLIAADRCETGKNQEAPVLHVSLAPAQITPDEFNQGRRVLFPSEVLFRQDADLVSGSAHQGCLDLVVAEDMAILRSIGRQNWQDAVLDSVA